MVPLRMASSQTHREYLRPVTRKFGLNSEPLACPLWVKSRHDPQARMMPALPPELILRPRKTDVCFVPKADIGRRAADFKLTTNSNLSGSCTGRSAGFAPLKCSVHIFRRSHYPAPRNPHCNKPPLPPLPRIYDLRKLEYDCSAPEATVGGGAFTRTITASVRSFFMVANASSSSSAPRAMIGRVSKRTVCASRRIRSANAIAEWIGCETQDHDTLGLRKHLPNDIEEFGAQNGV